MKTAVDVFEQSSSEQPSAGRRKLGKHNLVKLSLALVLLSLVYFLASGIPIELSESGSRVISGFIMFWVLGGVFTITLLALSDRRG